MAGSLTDEVPSSVFLRLRAGLRAVRSAFASPILDSHKTCGFQPQLYEGVSYRSKSSLGAFNLSPHLSAVEVSASCENGIAWSSPDLAIASCSLLIIVRRRKSSGATGGPLRRASTTSINRRSTGSPTARRARRSICASRGARATPRRRATRRPRTASSTRRASVSWTHSQGFRRAAAARARRARPNIRSAVVRRAPRAIAQRADLDAWCPSTTARRRRRRRRAILLVHKKRWYYACVSPRGGRAPAPRRPSEAPSTRHAVEGAWEASSRPPWTLGGFARKPAR